MPNSALVLDPDEVETAPKSLSLDPSEVEDAPGPATPHAAATPLPAGAVGPLPGVPRPQVNMQVPDIAHTIVNAIGNAESSGMQSQTVPGPSGRPISIAEPNYGQNALPTAARGARELLTPGQRTQGATDVLRGINTGLSSTILPLGVAPAEIAAGVVGSAAGSYAAPRVVKQLGGNQQQQDLAREAGAALPLAAGVGTGLLRDRVGGELPLAPRAPQAQDVEASSEPLSLPAPQVEQTAGPAALPSGERPQLTAGGSAASVPIPQEPGPLYRPEATQRTAPIPLYPMPAPLPSRPGFIVGPDGQAVATVAGELPASVDQYSIDSDRQHPVARVIGRDIINGQPIVRRIPGEDLSPTPIIGGVAQRQLPRGPIQLPAPAEPDITQHPLGEVTGIDEDSGLPIVKRTLSMQGESAPPQTDTAGQMSPEAQVISARAADAAQPARRESSPVSAAQPAAIEKTAPTPPPTRDTGPATAAPSPSTLPPLPLTDDPKVNEVLARYRAKGLDIVRPSDLTVDPQRFQYKLNTGPGGVTGLLKGRRWNDDLAGVVSAWRDPADGKTYVVNGHHRVALAKAQATTDTPAIVVRYLNEPTASAARATGALQNIAEGRGTALDAAKFFRDTGMTPADLDARGISMGEATAANGLALAKLSPQLFDDAVSGKLRMGRAIAIGNAAPEPEQQEALLRLIGRAEAKGRKVTDDTIDELGRMVRGAGTHSETQNTLFGSQEQTKNLALEKAETSAYIRDTLSKERRLFSHVSDQGRADQLGAAGNLIKPKANAGIAERAAQAQELYDRLSSRTGAVDDILNRAASRLAKGDDSSAVKREAYQSTRAALAETLAGGEGLGSDRVQENPGRGRPAQEEAGDQATAVAKTEPALPGFENAVREQSASQAEERGRQLTNELTRPKGDIDKAAGEMERKSPLFEGTEANPQGGLFRGGLEERHGGLGAINPLTLLPDSVKDYLAHEAALIGKSRDLHGGIYDLDAQYDADVLRANKLMQSLPGTPADQEAVYHHLENPKEPLTKTQREILDKLAPLNKQAESIYQKLNPEKGLTRGYVHRIAQQKGSLLDRILQGSQSTGRGNVLKKSAAASKKRSMLAIESPGGKAREVVSVARGRVTAWHDNVPTDIGGLRSGLTKPDEILDDRLGALEREEKSLKNEQRVLTATPSRAASSARRLRNIADRLQQIEADRNAIEHEHTAENLPNRLWRDKDGRHWTFKQATTREIEAQTPVEYFKNAAASTITNWLELRKAERANDYIEKVKSSPDFASFGIKPRTPAQIPDGWKSTQLPQFSGYFFEPHVSEVFDHYAKQLAEGKPGILQQVGDFLTTSIFLNPIAHIPNLTANWMAEKGVSVANPLTWGPGFKAGVKAFNAVVHQNQDFLEALDEGAPLRSQRSTVRQFSDLLIKKLQDEAQDPSVAEKLQGALGSIVNVPAALRTVVNFMADKSTWPVHDLYFLQAAYSKLAQNPALTLKQALEDTAKYIPDERLPTRIFNNKAIADVMSNPLLTMFSRYHYGVLKGYGQILKNLSGAGFKQEGVNAKGEPVNRAGRTEDQEKARALSIAAGLAIMLAVVYPALDQLAEKATGNKDARVRRAGYSNFADALNRAIHGDIPPLQSARSMVTPAVLGETAVDLAANRDVFGTGRKIYNEHGTGREIAEQVGTRLVESLSPAQLAMRASESHESFKKTLLGLVGISFPRHGALRLAAELNADRFGDEPQTPGERKKSILRSQARYSAWQGDRSGIEEARTSGLFSPQDMRKLEHEASENPLQYETRSMPVEDVLKVWRVATPAEKRDLLPVLVRKGGHISAGTKADRLALRSKLTQAIAETRQGAR